MPERRALGTGDAAPSFRLPAVDREGTIALDDYRGRTPVLLGLFRGLHCPFCRRQVVQLGTTRQKLAAIGVETLAVVNTPVERARLYFKYHPAPVPLAADPEATTHRAFGVPAFSFVEEEAAARWPVRVTMRQFRGVLINPTGELPSPRNGMEANTALNAKDGFQMTDVDARIFDTHGTQLAAHFLIDRRGVIRWVHIEAGERIADIGRFPTDDEILAAAREMPA
jgi:peroxiredoxin